MMMKKVKMMMTNMMITLMNFLKSTNKFDKLQVFQNINFDCI